MHPAFAQAQAAEDNEDADESATAKADETKPADTASEQKPADTAEVDANTLDYGVTVDDPATFTKPWTASIPMVRSNDRLFEYACHEGNYSLTNMLKGSRAEDK